MYRKHAYLGKRATCWLVLGVHALMTAAAGAETAEGDMNNVLPFSQLELTLRLSKTDYVLGEPIAVYVELSNSRDLPVRAHGDFHWRYRAGTEFGDGYPYLLLILFRDGKPERYMPYGMEYLGRQPPRLALIDPGAKLRTKELMLGMGEHATSLKSEGTVEIAAEFHSADDLDMITSNRVRIRISAPGGRDADAYETLRERQLLPYLGYLLFLRKSFREEDIQALKTFLERYSETAYGPYARFSLGQMYFYRGRYEEAIQEFNRIMHRDRDTPLHEDARYLAAESSRILLKPLEADHVLRLLIRFHPDTPAADEAQELRRHLRGVAFRGREILLRDDPRLDVTITFELPSYTLIEDVFKVVSRLSGVPLRVAPELEETRFLGRLERTLTLRAFMDELEGSERRRWVRDGEGYRLVPAAESEPKGPPDAESNEQ